MMKPSRLCPTLLALLLVLAIPQSSDAGPVGYYRMPTLNGSTVVFVAEGDLWKVPVSGGVATRLTSHPGNESRPEISPDGRTVAFVGTYEGPNEVYTMPIDGGRPTRRTFGISAAGIAGWASNSEVAAPQAPAASPESMPTAFSAMGIMANADGPLRGEYFIIKQTGLTIGRDPGTCDVVYEGSTVSRQHARLEYTDTGLMVRSLSDLNQTFLNDHPVTEAPVKAGDSIRIEQVSFKVLPHGATG